MMNRSHHQTPVRGFTLIELLVVISIIALLIGILLPALGAARTTARKMQNSTQLRGIHQALVIFAQSNKNFYPGLDSDGTTMTVAEVNATGTYTGYNAGSNGRNSSGVFAIALNTDSFTPDYLLNPVEINGQAVGGTDTDLDFDDNPAGDPINFSYANLFWQESGTGPQEGPRVAEWKESYNTQAIVIGDRRIGSGTTRSSLWTQEGEGRWEGTITRNDNSTGYEQSDEGYTTQYGGNTVEEDSLFETDGTVNGAAAPTGAGQKTDCRLIH
ncbi:MAG: prepilin-type N-terminal cleavage/methylation domain-containing protein [Planctomycetota bacterium]